jgi:hypothetical protein
MDDEMGTVLNALPPTAAANGNGHSTAPLASKVGEPAPSLKLPDLTGKQVALSEFRGSKTLVLFWNPGCGFCQRLLSDLKAWESSRRREHRSWWWSRREPWKRTRPWGCARLCCPTQTA